jgi:hypothetical protein
LHLTRERMQGEQRIDALQIGTRREHDGRAAAGSLVAAGGRHHDRYGE